MKRFMRLSALVMAPVTAFLLLPANAFADGLSPAAFQGITHLLIGNIVIGVLEGALISFIFKTAIKKTIKIMILANYASMLAVIIIFYLAGNFLPENLFPSATIYNAWTYVGIFIAATFVLTVLLEWPFCLWALKERPGRTRLSLYASVMVQVASYALLVPYYIIGGDAGSVN